MNPRGPPNLPISSNSPLGLIGTNSSGSFITISSNGISGLISFLNFFRTEYNLYSSSDVNPAFLTLKNFGVNNSLPE